MKFLNILIVIIIFLSFFVIPAKAQTKIELINKRTETSKTYLVGENKYSIDAHINAIHYKDDYLNSNETWKDIDLTWDGKRLDKAPYILIKDDKSLVYSITSKKTSDSLSIAPLSFGGLPANDKDFIIGLSVTGFSLTRQINTITDKNEAYFAITDIPESMSIKVLAYDSDGYLIDVDSYIENHILYESIQPNKLTTSKFPIFINPIIDINPSADTDDMTEDYHTGETIDPTYSNIVKSGATGNVRIACGNRFSVSVNKSVEVTSCYTTFYSIASTEDIDTDIAFQLDSSPVTFSAGMGTYDITNRNYTTANVTWTANNIGSGLVNSPSLIVPAQELFDNYSVTSIVVTFFSRYNAGDMLCRYRTYNTYPSDSISLHIEYTEGTALSVLLPPSNLTLTRVSTNSVLATWNKAESANTTILIVNSQYYPKSLNDNYFGCNVTGESYQFDGLQLDTGEFFVSAWSENETSFSSSYVFAKIGGENMIEISTVIIGIILFLVAVFVKHGLVWIVPMAYNAVVFYFAVINGWEPYWFVPIGGFALISLMVFVIKCFQGDLI